MMCAISGHTIWLLDYHVWFGTGEAIRDIEALILNIPYLLRPSLTTFIRDLHVSAVAR